jgi:hypothetical protein
MVAQAFSIPAFGIIDWVLFGVAVANVALALVVLRHAPQREENRVFAVTGISVALWTLTNALFRITTSHDAAVLWAEVSYAAALALAASFLHFSWIYPKRSLPPWSGAKLFTWLGALFIALLAFVPGLILKDVDIIERRILTAPGIFLIATFMVVTSALAFLRFWHNQSRLRGIARAQARYVLFGAALTAVFGLTFNLFLPLLGNYRWVWAGPVCSLFFVGFTVYSIVAHHLFDIKVLIRRTLVYSLLLAALAGAFSGLETLLSGAIGLLVGEDNPYTAHLFTALIISLGVQPIRHYLERLVRRFLFKDETEEVELSKGANKQS